MKVCAGIVLYNPDIKRLKKCIDAVYSQVDRLILINNASDNTEEIEKELSEKSFIWIKNEKNLGIAAALNQLIKYADENDYKWVLTLDQDSICEDGLVEKLSAVTAEQKDNSNTPGYRLTETDNDRVAMVSPLIIDRGLSEINRKRNEPLPVIEDVPMCITSGCLTNVSAILATGGFSEWLFVYDVDREMCIRLLRKGYRLLRVNGTRLYHEHGQKTVVRKFLFKKIVYRNYSPVSVYYMTRNLVFMLRKYGSEYAKNPILRRVRMYIAFFVKFIFEPDRKQRLKAFRQGVKEGKAVCINDAQG
ncbi:MAG: glycosyltransferase family 2 protein [Oscillospiraceae bacterium]|nr:glycosyltransferase family 2 protein [Oscillospiraceae bacterium]